MNGAIEAYQRLLASQRWWRESPDADAERKRMDADAIRDAERRKLRMRRRSVV